MAWLICRGVLTSPPAPESTSPAKLQARNPLKNPHGKIQRTKRQQSAATLERRIGEFDRGKKLQSIMILTGAYEANYRGILFPAEIFLSRFWIMGADFGAGGGGGEASPSPTVLMGWATPGGRRRQRRGTRVSVTARVDQAHGPETVDLGDVDVFGTWTRRTHHIGI